MSYREKKGSSLNEYRHFAQHMESDSTRSFGFPDVYSLEKSAEKQILAGAGIHAYPASPVSKKTNLQSNGSVLECVEAQSPYSGLSQLSSAFAGTVIYPVCQQLSLAAAQQPRKLDIMIYRKLNLEYSWTRLQRRTLMFDETRITTVMKCSNMSPLLENMILIDVLLRRLNQNEASSSDWMPTETSHHHLLSWLHYIISTLFVHVCAHVSVCLSVGRGKTPAQSLFNFPDIELHGRPISRAVDLLPGKSSLRLWIDSALCERVQYSFASVSTYVSPVYMQQ